MSRIIIIIIIPHSSRAYTRHLLTPYGPSVSPSPLEPRLSGPFANNEFFLPFAGFGLEKPTAGRPLLVRFERPRETGPDEGGQYIIFGQRRES